MVARLSLIVPVYRAGITTLLAKAGMVSASPGQIPPRSDALLDQVPLGTVFIGHDDGVAELDDHSPRSVTGRLD